MNQIHRSDAPKSKFCVALYNVEMEHWGESEYDVEETFKSVFPRQYGHNTTPGNFTVAGGVMRFQILKAAKKQTTPTDFEDKLSRAFGRPVKVQTNMAVPSIGEGNYPGSPREGTQRRTPRDTVQTVTAL